MKKLLILLLSFFHFSVINIFSAELYGVYFRQSPPGFGISEYDGLTLYYDDNKDSHWQGDVFTYQEDKLPVWKKPESIKDEHIKVIVLDESMKNANISSTAHSWRRKFKHIDY